MKIKLRAKYWALSSLSWLATVIAALLSASALIAVALSNKLESAAYCAQIDLIKKQ